MTGAVWLVAVFGAAATLAALGVRAALASAFVERLHPRTRARAMAGAALLPPLAGALVLAATFLPLGLPAHCVVEHGHLHHCLACALPPPPLAVSVLALGYAGWAIGGLARVGRAFARAHRATRRLAGAEARAGDLAVLPVPGHVAFVAGFVQPRTYVSEAARAWTAVLAHERDHARHRDPLARLLARLALVVAPGLGGWLEPRLARAQELAADEAAAGAVGDRLEVARQLVDWARLHASAPPLALAFGHGDVGERVRLLIDPPRYLAGPSRVQLGVLAVGAAAAILSLAPSIHRGVEGLVHLLEH